MAVHLEVSRVHTQGEGMQLTEVQKTCFQVVDFGHSKCNSTHHSYPVLLGAGREGAHVLPVGEVSLGLRVHDQHPGQKKTTRVSAFVNDSVHVGAASGVAHIYLAIASLPMSSTFPDTLAQKVFTLSLSLAVRLVILPVDCESLNAVISFNSEGLFMLETEQGHTPNLLRDRKHKTVQLRSSHGDSGASYHFTTLRKHILNIKL